MIIRIRDIIAPHFWNTFNSKKTNQIYSGGRNSTKTSMIAIKIVKCCLEYDNCSAVALRNHKTDLRKSVYKEIKRACKRLGLIENIDYTATVSPMEIKFNNGNTAYFAGGDDFEAVKGTIDEDRLIKIVWFEELTGFKDEETIEQIKATFTRGNNDWFMALYSFNPPKNKFDWVNKWVESKKGLKDYLIKGYATNQKRLEYLEKTVKLIDIAGRIDTELKGSEAQEIIKIINSYSAALDLLDDYDYKRINKPKGITNDKVITYEECKKIINNLKFNNNSNLFALERKEGLKSILCSIYQSFDGVDLYPTIQEKVANLLYMVVKNHVFIDGNKRIAATLFIYALQYYDLLITNGKQIIDNNTLVAVTLLIAESAPKEKDIIIDLLLNFLIEK